MKIANPDRRQFAQIVQACGDGPVPFVVSLPNDQLTPVSVFANLRDASDYAFILESVEHGTRLGRYSFMGAQPRKVFEFDDSGLTVRHADGSSDEPRPCSDPLAELERLAAPLQASWPDHFDLPPLLGGLVGYLGYDCVHSFEPVGEMLPDAIGLPNALWMLADTVVCFDHLYSQILLTSCVDAKRAHSVSPDKLYDELVAEADSFAQRFLRPASLDTPGVHKVLEQPDSAAVVDSNFTQEGFEQVVRDCKEHIVAGDIFQIVPSQRFSVPLKATPLDVYRALRKLNPSSYMFALKFKDREVVGSSPETQLRCENGRLMMRPIAGSRPRTGDAVEDDRLAAELLADPKELAEHKMLVDLVRNDLGRVAATGSVEIASLLNVERYSHIMHITSEVLAELADDSSLFDALRATFPAGTLSGAPKVRAMQLINEFEPVRRNLYGGLVGYIDHVGNCDSCIAIRMMMAADGKAHVQAGGGVVADSVPTTEYEESQHKARAVMKALAEAERK